MAEPTFTAPETAIEAIRQALEVASKQLPQPACTYADHSYPAFNKRQMEEHAFSVASALLLQLEEAQRDAARYRWLRTYPNNVGALVYGPTGGLLRRDHFLDAAIDSAILAQQGGKQ